MEEKKLYNAVQKTITLADGRQIMIETGNDRTKLTILRSSVKTVLKDEDEAPAK